MIMMEKNENSAKAQGKSLAISLKHSIEICSFIRGKQLERAKDMLNKVINKKMPVPYKRYNMELAHRKKIGPGRYPVKTAKAVLNLLESAEANAQVKGLSPAELVISRIVANKGPTAWHYGRKRSRKMKRANIEIFLEKGQTK